MIERFVVSGVAISTKLRFEKLQGENWELTVVLNCVTNTHETDPIHLVPYI